MAMFNNLLLLIIIGDTVAGQQSQSKCPSGWEVYEDHCYRFIKNSATWSSAEVACRLFGGNLVKIDDANENSWIIYKAKAYSMDHPWIGLYKYYDGWRWVIDFQVPLFFGWHRYEPSGDGDCGHLHNNLNYDWNDVPCNGMKHYICEINQNGRCP